MRLRVFALKPGTRASSASRAPLQRADRDADTCLIRVGMPPSRRRWPCSIERGRRTPGLADWARAPMGEPVLEAWLVDAVAAWHLWQFLTERKFLKAHDARALLEPHSAVGMTGAIPPPRQRADDGRGRGAMNDARDRVQAAARRLGHASKVVHEPHHSGKAS